MSRRSRAAEPKLPTIATVGHLVARKRHADVLRALWLLRDSHPDLRWIVAGDGPERSGLEQLARELQLGGRVKLLGQLPPARPGGGPGGDRVRAAERRPGVRGRLRRGDGGRRARDRLPRRGGPEEIAASGAIRLVAPAIPRRWRRSCARCSTTPPGAASSATAPARPSSMRSPGRPAGGRPSPPTRRRCGDRPVLFVTNHAPPFRVGAFAKLHEREDVTFALVGGDVRHGGGAGEEHRCVPGAAGARAQCLRTGRLGRLPGGGGRALGPLALPSAYAGARRARVPFVLWATIWAHPRPPHTRSPTCHRATSTATPTRS